MRLDALAHVQRRTKWVEVKDLLIDERAAFGRSVDQAILSYAESWLLVYHLMTSPTRLPQFRAYLKAIQVRKDQNRRFDDAETHFGNLDRLDEELHRESIVAAAIALDIITRKPLGEGGETMSPSTLTIEPLLSAADREELSHLDYLLARLVELRDRGLIAADSYATVVAESQSKRDAIERQGRYQAAMKQAHDACQK